MPHIPTTTPTAANNGYTYHGYMQTTFILLKRKRKMTQIKRDAK